MIRHLAAIGWLVLFAGCIHQPSGELPPDLLARRQALIAVEQWSVDGRMAMRFDQRGYSGALYWQQRQDQVEARFHGPLGVGAFNLSGSADEIVVEAGNGEVYYFSEPETMMRQQFGWTIPVAAMRYWLLGVPQPGVPVVEELDADGNLASIQQRGWQIFYDRYTEVGEWRLPKKIVLNGVDVSLRLAVHRWNLDSN